MDRLRDEIVKWLYNETTLLEVECEAAGDGLLSLLDAERCEWTHNAEYYPNLYHTSCGKVLSEDSPEQRPFCPCCGRRIEVKDGQG